MRNYLSRRNSNFPFGSFFDDTLDEFFKPMFFGVKERTMQTDLKETEDGYQLKIDMPGFEKSDISLTLDNGYLTVEAKREEKDDDKDYIRRERSFSCKRSYFVGEAITEEDIKARYNNGTLQLNVPKKEKQVLPKKNIEIEG